MANGYCAPVNGGGSDVFINQIFQRVHIQSLRPSRPSVNHPCHPCNPRFLKNAFELSIPARQATEDPSQTDNLQSDFCNLEFLIWPEARLNCLNWPFFSLSGPKWPRGHLRKRSQPSAPTTYAQTQQEGPDKKGGEGGATSGSSALSIKEILRALLN